MKSLAKPFRIILILLILLVLPISAAAQRDIQSPQATDRYVSPNGTDGGGCTNPANPCKTIDYALDQADAGDTIHLEEGVYYETVTFNVGFNMVGAGAGKSIIDGNGVGPVVYVYDDPEPSSISNLTIRNGSAMYGGGLYTFGTLTVEGVIIEEPEVNSLRCGL